MIQDPSKVYLHISFSTLDCQEFIGAAMRKLLEPFTVEVLKSMGAHTQSLYIHSDHLHVLCTLPVTMSPNELVSRLKKSTSTWINRRTADDFAWQEGHAVFSVSPLKVNAVNKLIRNQPNHHKKITWKEEMKIFYEFYEIKYDNELIWR
jgi:REP element-mobilizing transposase RayT